MMPEEITPPQDWAFTQYTRGKALYDLTTGDRERNLREAITCYGNALRDWTEADSPREWSAAQVGQGMAYWDLYMENSGDLVVNLHAAIDSYQAGLRVSPRAGPRVRPEDTGEWQRATTQFYLGIACEALAHETYDVLGYDRRDSAWYQSAMEAYAAAERGYLASGSKKDAAKMRSYQSYDSPPPTALGRLKRWLTRGG